MSWNSERATTAGVSERGFTVSVAGAPVPGVYWKAQTAVPRGLVLLGHGGTAHKRADYIQHMAGLLVTRGLAAMAIDGPGHGDRLPEGFRQGPDSFERQWRDGGGTEGMLTDWKAALDFIESEEQARPTGWWGLSMGTMMGLPVCATEPRIQVALLGLMGTWGPNGDDLRRLAADVRCPLRFLVQWDDEIVPRAACLELFDLLGSRHKTLHGNPGKHQAVPAFEMIASADFLAAGLAPG